MNLLLKKAVHHARAQRNEEIQKLADFLEESDRPVAINVLADHIGATTLRAGNLLDELRLALLEGRNRYRLRRERVHVRAPYHYYFHDRGE